MKTYERLVTTLALTTALGLSTSVASGQTATSTPASTTDEKKAAEGSKEKEAAAAEASTKKPVSLSTGDGSSTDVTEDPSKTYYFIGARYRGTVIPQFIQNIFVEEGGTIYSNTIGIEADVRKDGSSKVFGLQYVEYGFGDTLFLEKSKPSTANNWSVVNSGLKAIYATVDLLWSVPVHRNIDFEYGFGVGVGFMWGDLMNNWVYDDPNGTLSTSTGRRFSMCRSENDGGGICARNRHSSAPTAKVNNFIEKSWFDGGSVPSFFPHLSLPQVGFRFKPVKQFQARLGLGFSLTGFWFGLSGDYGLEKPQQEAAAPSNAGGPSVHFLGQRF